MGDKTISTRVALAALLATLGITACDDTVPKTGIEPGIDYRSVDAEIDGATYRVHRTTVNLEENVGVGVLTNSHVTAVQEPTEMAEKAGAEAVINGDLFDWKNLGRLEDKTEAPVGPVIDAGKPLTSAVPESQAIGAKRPDQRGVSTETVFGITPSGDATVTSAALSSHVFATDSSGDQIDLGVNRLNAYKIGKDEVGVYDRNWGGDASLAKVHCTRKGHCDPERFEVHVDSNGVVTRAAAGSDSEDGKHKIEGYEKILVGRGDGAGQLRKLSKGDNVQALTDLAPEKDVVNALGGLPLVVDGKPLTGVTPKEKDAQTAVGVDKSGTHLELVVVEDPIKLDPLRDYMVGELGCHSVVKLDGGGSSVMGTRDGKDIEVRNNLREHVNQRKMSNALGVFSINKRLSQLAGAWGVDAGGDAGPAFYIDENGNIEVWSLTELPGRYVGKLKLDHPDGWDYTARLKAAETPGGGVGDRPESATLHMTFDRQSQTLELEDVGDFSTYKRYIAG